MKLKREGYSLRSVPQKGQNVTLLDIANLSPGGEAIDVSSIIHSGFSKIAVALTNDMGLRFCGVDIMVTRGDISDDPKNSKDCSYYVLEINASPGLISHYIKDELKADKLKEEMYLKILRALGEKKSD